MAAVEGRRPGLWTRTVRNIIILTLIIFNNIITIRTRIVCSRSDCRAERLRTDQEMFHSAKSHPADPEDNILHLPRQVASPLRSDQSGACWGAGTLDLYQGQETGEFSGSSPTR